MIKAKTTIGSGRPGRPEKYAAENILKAALDLYWTEGIASLSVNNLVRRIGMPKPSLYRHFPSEDSLQASVLLAYEATALNNLNDIMLQPAPFSRQLTKVTDALIDGITTHTRGCLLFQMREMGNSLGPLARDACEQVFVRFSTSVKDWIDASARKGEVRLQTDSAIATHLFLGLITLIRNGLRDGLDDAGVRVLADAHLAGVFQPKASESA